MKCVKTLGSIVAVAAALMAFAASASATTITSPTNTVYTGEIHAESEGHLVFNNPIAKIECLSTIKGTIETHGPETTPHGPIASLTFTNCTNSWHLTVIATGSLAIHWTGNHMGTLTSDGATIEATRFGVICRYATEETLLGKLTDSHTAGAPIPVSDTAPDTTATLPINASVPFHGGSALCGTKPVEWTGSYKITTPDRLYIDEE